MHRTLAAPALALVLVVGAVACTDDDGSASDTTGAADTTATTEEPRDLSVSTPEGEVSLNLDGELPDDWPEDFPLPDDTEAAGSGSLSGSDSGVMVGVFRTSTAGRDAFSFYTEDDSLEPSGARSAGVGSGFAGSVDIAGGYDGSVTVAALDDTTFVVVVLGSDGTGDTTTTTAAAGES